MGTPAFPTAARVATKIQVICSVKEKVMPELVPTNSTVSKINAAQAFILIVVHSGKLKRVITGRNFKLSSAHSIAKGRVALEDLDQKAKNKAGAMALAVFQGDSRCAFKNSGKTIKAWTRFANTTQ